MVTSVHIAKITATPIYVDYDPPLGPYQGGNSSTPTRGSSALIVRLETDAGIIGWGEGTGELKMDVGALLRGHHVGDIESAIAKMRQSGLEPGPQSGVEMAMWDALGKAVELPLCRLLGGVIRTRVDFCGCLGLKEPQAAAETARSYIDNWGFRHIKTKAGRDAEEDLRIAGAIQKEIGENAFLRPDANSGYGPDEAEEQMKKMRDLGVRHFEDPCAIDYLDYLARFRRELGMCILVNMGVGRPEGIVDTLQAGAADYVMPDTPAAGGVLYVQKVADTAAAFGVSCLTHCSHDFGLKTIAVAHIAAATPNFSGPNDTCYHGLSDDILTQHHQFEDGQLAVPMTPGLGVEVDPEKVERYRVNV